MQMTLRWYGSKYDTVTLKQIRQIPGVTGVISTLYGTAPGEVWEMDDILALKTEIEAAGLQLAGIESVNIHDAIKIGSPDREQYIENYITTLERLGQAGIHMVCYNFMPVFDWTRTELARMRPDGSTVLAYNQAAVDAIDPAKMFDSIAGDMNGTVMPGWEPERMAHVKELFEMYKDVDDEKLFANLKYFLERIMPTCDKYNINIEIMLALYDIGFDGPIRPDHGRMIWDEVAMPGYGLYDRALGATYLNGLWEAIEKSHKQK